MGGPTILLDGPARELDGLYSNPVAYLAIMTASEVDAVASYLSPTCLLTQLSDLGRHRLMIAVVPASSAQFYADRLGSGLHCAKVCNSWTAALVHLVEVS